ncbi:hypothetical protein AMS68_003242 [Peltaster fructicola]|uniref:Deacetylase complex subunit Sds3 n=1 Tax=Peltaster fructicola TaxID=286661 RepID=A0A6H0XSU9_9PEZI|nr:hypothetical protein AMS68_003242 [Peltaster fructicola]
MAVARHTDSLSPPPNQPTLTKRDVRRNRMMDKLQYMIDSFAANQHQHYRAQLQAIQADMTLILRSDPYEGVPLDDNGEDIRAVIETMGANLPPDEAAQKDYFAMAGSEYRSYVREVNNAIEQRDADLVALHNRYESSMVELDRLTQQKLHQAEEEHKALSNTIRSRLIATITKRRQQLLRDKEQLDIADSNALLLHPSQFTINNPGSPGGGQNRKTRHLRHRATSPGGDDAAKRKRKAAALDEDGNESPAPAFRLPPPDNLGGGRSPFKDAREKNSYTQYEAPAYSLERIFTDKELALATDTARMATYRYFHQPQPDSGAQTNGTGGSSVADEAQGDADDPMADADTNGTPPPTAQEMERSTSHQVVTRGHVRANPLAALSDLATAAVAASGPTIRENPFAPVVPNYHAVTRSEKAGAPAPPAVGSMDIENDFEMMRRGAPGSDISDTADEPQDPQTLAVAFEMRQNLLEQALAQPSGAATPFRLPLLEDGPARIGKGVDRVAATGFAPVLSAASVLEQRLRAQTVSGANASLSSALRGGEPMSRATSAAGSEAGEGVGRMRRRIVA